MSAPKIMFDDGSRIMQEQANESQLAATLPSATTTSARGTVPIQVYYEIDRVAKEVVDKLDWSANTSRGQLLNQILASIAVGNNDASTDEDDSKDDKSEDKMIGSSTEQKGPPTTNNDDDGFLCRIALQFPDELLGDAPEVSWLMESAIVNAYNEKLTRPILDITNATIHQKQTSTQSQIDQHIEQIPLLFILGDTTYGSCCPDEVSANHLNANLIVHYGYACLAPTESVPVVYAFGLSAFVGTGTSGVAGSDDGNDDTTWKECVRLVSNEAACQGAQQHDVDDDKLDEALAQLSTSEEKQQCKKLLILYEVRYHHAMEELRLEFEKKMGQFQIVVGAIPKQQLSVRLDQTPKGGQGCCGEGGGCDSGATAVPPASNSCSDSNSGGDAQPSQSCCEAKDSPSCCAQAGEGGDGNTSATKTTDLTNHKDTTTAQQGIEKQYIPRTIGGLEITDKLDLSQYTLLYIGDDMNIDSHDNGSNARLLHILLRCGAPDGPRSLWSYSPIHQRLTTDILNSPLSSTNSTTLSTALSRTLRRRYFLLNKTKLATTIAILIGTTSNSYSFRKLLRRTRHRIQSTGRTAYTFSVGKLSTAPNKLTNFAEIDAYVIIACGESIAKFWKMEREEMLVPVLTPLELDVALGFREWDGRYSCDFGDLVRWDEEDGVVDDDDVIGGDDGEEGGNVNSNSKNAAKDGNDGNDSSDDEPFFSMISGKYEQSKTISASKQNAMNNDTNLEALPGQGKLIEYRSEAAEFLKKREYQGLEANVGETEVKAAVLGQVGIASNYGE